MSLSHLKSRLARFCRDTRGVVTVEMVISLPLLIWGLAATFEFFEVHRYKAMREKATYTVSDMFSREQASVNAAYLDGAHALFNSITNDTSDVQLRISVVTYEADRDRYSVVWSRTRGSGPMGQLSNSDVRSGAVPLPEMLDAQQIVLVESHSKYDPLFRVGLDRDMPVHTSQFMGLRFAPRLCLDDNCG